MIQTTKISTLLICIGTALMGLLLLAGCGNEKDRIYTVGIINTLPVLDQALAGFKSGMTDQGYIEGKNIRYIYEQPITGKEKLSAWAEKLMSSKVDIIFTVTTPAALAAKQAAAGTQVPVVFSVVIDPIGAGIVDSFQHPKGNITGVAYGRQEARRLEWLVRIAPGIKHIYMPFNPKDKAPVSALRTVSDAAAKLGVKLITPEVYDDETLNNAIFNIPDQADAVFLLPDSFRGTRLQDMVKEFTRRRLPISVSNTAGVKKYGMLTSYGNELYFIGKQAARQADLIFKGSSPADIPVETAEFYLAINLKVAGAIGLDIPDDILRQADIIVR